MQHSTLQKIVNDVDKFRKDIKNKIISISAEFPL